MHRVFIDIKGDVFVDVTPQYTTKLEKHGDRYFFSSFLRIDPEDQSPVYVLSTGEDTFQYFRSLNDEIGADYLIYMNKVIADIFNSRARRLLEERKKEESAMFDL